MTSELNLPPDTAYRRLITQVKSRPALNKFFKRLHIARRMEVDQIRAKADIQPGDVVCDIGCGDGFWSNHLAHTARLLVGIDPFAADLAKTKVFASTRAIFVNAVAECIPVATESVDKIISVCVFEHCFDDRQAFAESFRILRPGGKLVATVDSLNSRFIAKEHRQRHRKACYVNQYYDLDSLQNKLHNAGFSSVEASYMMGSRIAIWWEILLGRYGSIVNLLSPAVYPLLLLAEKREHASGYKILVVAYK